VCTTTFQVPPNDQMRFHRDFLRNHFCAEKVIKGFSTESMGKMLRVYGHDPFFTLEDETLNFEIGTIYLRELESFGKVVLETCSAEIQENSSRKWLVMTCGHRYGMK